MSKKAVTAYSLPSQSHRTHRILRLEARGELWLQGGLRNAVFDLIDLRVTDIHRKAWQRTPRGSRRREDRDLSAAWTDIS